MEGSYILFYFLDVRVASILHEHVSKQLAPEMLDRWCFLDALNGQFWLFSDHEVKNGLLPPAFDTMHCIPSGLLIPDDLLPFAVQHGFSGSFGWSYQSKKWKFLPKVMNRDLTYTELMYARHTNMSNLQLETYLGLEGDYGFGTSDTACLTAEKMARIKNTRQIWLNTALSNDSPLAGVSSIGNVLRKILVDPYWVRQSCNSNPSELLVRNYKFKPSKMVHYYTFPCIDAERAFNNNGFLIATDGPAIQNSFKSNFDALEQLGRQRPTLNALIKIQHDKLDSKVTTDFSDTSEQSLNLLSSMYGLLHSPNNPYVGNSSPRKDLALYYNSVPTDYVVRWFLERKFRMQHVSAAVKASHLRKMEIKSSNQIGVSFFNILMEMVAGQLELPYCKFAGDYLSGAFEAFMVALEELPPSHKGIIDDNHIMKIGGNIYSWKRN